MSQARAVRNPFGKLVASRKLVGQMKRLAALFLFILVWGCSSAPPVADRPVLPDRFALLLVRGSGTLEVLENSGWKIGYDEDRKNPAWVAYIVPREVKYPDHKRLNFTTDQRTRARVSQGDYTNTGFSRGHMAPSFAMYTRHGPDVQREAYRMSNICPQRQELNGGVWNDLEEYEAGQRADAPSWARRYGWVLVITGPVYDQAPQFLSDNVKIEVPDSFYKILLRQEEGQRPVVIAFLMPHQEAARRQLEAYLVSVDEIERLTGLDFFSALPDEVENDLEASIATGLWPKAYPL
jgi:endonuclease G